MQRSTIGVGSALRKAREARGVTLEEASRDIKVRAELLEALEEEDFDRLAGDVYVRGCLRSYSTYLGLSADTVVAAYTQNLTEPASEPQAIPPPTEPAVDARRRRDNHRLWIMVAATLLAVAAAFGVLSTREAAPPPASLPTEAPLVAPPARGITVAVLARQDVEVTVRIDGAEPEGFTLRPGESRSFYADTSLTVRLDPGNSARVTVDGRDLGFPGNPTHPWKQTFSFDTGDESPPPAG
ncbi:MAG TPA: helix-turn-helix domain-containing protein [Actinomycetota bacterium]